MLQLFYTIIRLGIIYLFISMILDIYLPIFLFEKKRESVVKIYDYLKKERILDSSYQSEDIIEISYKKDKIEFSTTQEASIEIENLINEALEIYDMLGEIATDDDELISQKDELIRICYEVRVLRWQQQ